MFRERNEWPSTAGEAEERSGYMELAEVPGPIFSGPPTGVAWYFLR